MDEIRLPEYELLDEIEPDPNPEHGVNSEAEMDVDPPMIEENNAHHD